jgi:hypothetical protein
MWLYLITKPSHVGVDVDGLAYPLHQLMVHTYQMRAQGHLPSIVLSSHSSEWWRPSGDVKLLGRTYLMES